MASKEDKITRNNDEGKKQQQQQQQTLFLSSFLSRITSKLVNNFNLTTSWILLFYPQNRTMYNNRMLTECFIE